VTVAWVRSLNIAPYNVAVGRGYYAQEGLAVETAEFASTADVVSALGTGQTDVNVGAISAGNFNAWQRGIKMYVVAAMSIYPAEGLMPTNVMARKDLYDSGAVRGVPDLRGRTFAVNARGNITEYTMWRVLSRRGMGLDDVNAPILGFPDMVSALANGSVDAFIGSEPFGTIALDQGVGARLEEDQQTIGPVQFTHTLFSEAFAEGRADAATRFLAATLRASRELQGSGWMADPTLAKILEEEIGFKQELLGRSILPVFPTDLTVRVDDVEQMQEGLLQMGRLSYPAPIDVRPFVNTALAGRAREQVEARR
jgi:NitT/TauT family transport system substrate-binding protein